MDTSHKLERAMAQLDDHIVAAMVVAEALEIFQYCCQTPRSGLEDFCVQYVAGDYVVFGGVNRVIWTPSRGFRPDLSCCTKTFIKNFRELEGVA